SPRPPGSPTTRPSATTAPGASARAASRGLGLGLTLGDDADDAVGRLLDRELGDLDHGATESAVHGLGVLELLVDLQQLGVLLLAGAHVAGARGADLGEPLGVDRQAHDLGA